MVYTTVKNMTGLNPKAIEKEYNVRYIGDFDIPYGIEVGLFYSNDTTRDSRYLIVNRDGENIILRDGSSIDGVSLTAYVGRNKEVLVPTLTGSFMETSDQSVWCDRGSVVTRTNKPDSLIHVCLKDGRFIQIDKS